MSHHHDHDHSHGHTQEHDHDHDHPHGHTHEHTHTHSHEHKHEHSHEHKHEHSHGHSHAEDQEPDQPSPGTLSFEEKMIKLLEHWIRHNDDHADSYRDWAEKARAHGMSDAGEHLAEVAEMTGRITGKFEEILKTIKS